MFFLCFKLLSTSHVFQILGFCLCKIEWLGLLAEGSHELEGDNTTTSSQSIEERLIKVMIQLANEEEEFLSAEQIQSQNRQTLINLEKRKAVMVMMTSGLEMSYGRLSEELLKSCICPQCFQDNTEALDNIPQTSSLGYSKELKCLLMRVYHLFGRRYAGKKFAEGNNPWVCRFQQLNLC
ncbi:hypothetical protein SDJN02_19599, partial [Cucurbita argyrosperma subsp. argyrosperma]